MSYSKFETFGLIFVKNVHRYFGTQNISQKQPTIDVPIKRCSENMQQIYRRTHMSKFDFNKVY